MKRSGAQIALLVLSILGIIASALCILTGLAFIFFGSSAAVSQIMADAGYVATFAAVAGVLFVVVGLVDLIIAIFGVRGANNAEKIGGFWVLCIIGLVVNVISLVSTIYAGRDPSTEITGVLFVLIMFILACSIKKQNKQN